jgi:hypothetical protein
VFLGVDLIDMCSVFVPWCKDGCTGRCVCVADCNFGFVSVITVYHAAPVSTKEAAQVEKGEEEVAAAAAAAAALVAAAAAAAAASAAASA